MMELLAAGGNLLGTWMTNEANKDIANQANQFSAQQYATRYQTTVKDLQAAGLSPMLAYSQGAGSSPSGQVGHPQQNPVSSALEGYHKATERNMINATISNLEKEGKIKDEALNTQRAQTELYSAQRDRELATTGATNASATKTYQDINKEAVNQPNWIDNARNNAAILVENLNKLRQEIKTSSASAGQLEALTRKVDVDIKYVKELTKQSGAQIKQLLASTSKTEADTAQVQLLTKLTGLTENALRNKSEAELSFIKKNITPYLEEINTILRGLPK